MTNKEAIKILKKWYLNATDGMTKERLGYIEGWFAEKDKKAFELAIKALETVGNSDKLGDLISRSALLDRIDEERKYLLERGQTGAEHILVHNFRDLIDNAPTVEPCYQTTSCLDCKMYDKENHHCPRFCEVIRDLVNEVKERPQGEWLEDSGNIACSHCHTIWLYRRTNFCPECGAEMGKE